MRKKTHEMLKLGLDALENHYTYSLPVLYPDVNTNFGLFPVSLTKSNLLQVSTLKKKPAMRKM